MRTKKAVYGLSSICIISVCILNTILNVCAYTYGSPATATLSDKFVSIVANIKPSVVNIRTKKSSSNTPSRGNKRPFGGGLHGKAPSGKVSDIISFGSGIIVDKSGYIITNNHLIRDPDEIIVGLYDGTEFTAELVGTDPKTDIAILKIDATDLIPVKFGDSDSLKTGEIVLAIGNLFDLEQIVTSGIISAKGRLDALVVGHEGFIRTDAIISAGNSGGPLINLEGNVIGINTKIPAPSDSPTQTSFAVPINVARKVTEDIISFGRVTRGWLGVTAQAITPQFQKVLDLKDKQGALISDIEDGSPAVEAGIQSGDVVLEYDGKTVKDLFILMSLVTNTEINKKVEIVVLRNGKKLKLEAVIVERSRVKTAGKKGLLEDSGLIVQTLTSDLALNMGYEGKKGVIIANIQVGSPAQEAGLKISDLIVEVEHKPVANIEDFQQALLSAKDEEEILMLIKRPSGMSSFIVLKLK